MVIPRLCMRKAPSLARLAGSALQSVTFRIFLNRSLCHPMHRPLSGRLGPM
ncbi:Hypothetical protein CAP_8719 [Chondromyces apiculatus DSM 436]|uniref:Uncharacterized protein n=1 Tax=Chondromyces apiculatus DSM 436 TaxID=1192034 RepID=A0A017TG98_9BACT|nr:Hypothetical protein CAP_8719 [Chondromyces apiculatus DSM 436]